MGRGQGEWRNEKSINGLIPRFHPATKVIEKRAALGNIGKDLPDHMLDQVSSRLKDAFRVKLGSFHVPSLTLSSNYI